MLQNHLKKAHVTFTINGGYKNFERGRCFINEEVSDITCFKILYNKKYLSLTHQNVLGTLLSLNLKIETIGDILVNADSFFCISEQKDFIKNNLLSINNVPITLQEIDGTTLNRKIELEQKTVFTDSLRLDLVVSKIAGVSRNIAASMIENEFVKVNHLVVKKISTKCNESDILSIRKKGRFILLDTKNTSKKGKTILVFGKFI